MKNIIAPGLFDDHFLLDKLTKLGDPLQRLNNYIDWAVFRGTLEKALETEKKGNGGRPPFDKLMMFKELIIQGLYNLSDDQLEYQLVDRSSFRRFLGLKKSDKVPDSKTFWHFREQLSEKEVIEDLFKAFNEKLDSAGVFANEGKMVDASFVEAPRQRKNKEENDHIKSTGTAPEAWGEKPHKLCQKDVDARWTKKNGVSFYGYKNHVKACSKTKLIEEYSVTDASVHDSQAIEGLLTTKDEGLPLYADSAYTGEKQEETYKKKKVINKVHEMRSIHEYKEKIQYMSKRDAATIP